MPKTFEARYKLLDRCETQFRHVVAADVFEAERIIMTAAPDAYAIYLQEVPALRTKTFNVRVWTGPSTVEQIAPMVGLSAGTEHVYGRFEAEDAEVLRAQISNRFRDAGLSGYYVSDVLVSEVL